MKFRGALHDFPPPVEPDQRQHRLARDLPGAGQFVVKGIQQQEMFAFFRRREDRAEEAVRVGATDMDHQMSKKRA
jgi:hypothetical protein